MNGIGTGRDARKKPNRYTNLHRSRRSAREGKYIRHFDLWSFDPSFGRRPDPGERNPSVNSMAASFPLKMHFINCQFGLLLSNHSLSF
jgi:hypothetical protein